MDFNQIEMRRETIFKDAVLSAAEARSVEIISGAQQQAAKQLAEAQAACKLADHDAIAATLAMDTEREHSAAMQAARQDLLRHRVELVDGLFGEVEQRLATFAQGKDYEGWLVKKIKNEAKNAQKSDEYVVFVREDDIKHKDKLAKALPGARVEVDDTIRLGGAKLKAGRVMYDLTMDAMLEDERERFTQTSGLLLSDEAGGTQPKNDKDD